MRVFVFIIICIISYVCKVHAQESMLLIEMSPYTELYVNVDNKPYYAASSCAIIPHIGLGVHELLVTDKSTQEKEYLEFEIKKLPAHFRLQKTIQGYQIFVMDGSTTEASRNPKQTDNSQGTEVATKPPPKYIDDITIKADSILTPVETQEVNCIAYNETEMDYVRNQYIKAQSKSEFLKKIFDKKCLTRAQLQELILSSLTTKDKFEVVQRLHSQVEPTISLDELSTYFQGTPYYSDFLRLKKQNGE